MPCSSAPAPAQPLSPPKSDARRRRRGDGRSVVIATAFARWPRSSCSTGSRRRASSSTTTASSRSQAPPRSPSAGRCWRSARCRSYVAARRSTAARAPGAAAHRRCGARGHRPGIPELVPGVPEPRSAPARITLAIGLALYGLVGWRAFRTYRLTRRGADLLVVVGVVWLASALAAALLLSYLDLGWWIDTASRCSIAAIGAPVALDLRREAQSRPRWATSARASSSPRRRHSSARR